MATQIVSPKLRTALQIASAKAAELKRQEWQSRLDADCYTCSRDGQIWIAEGPAGQRFEFSRTQFDGKVLCMSQSGGCYFISPSELTGALVCDCPAHQKAGSCKHLVGFDAVRRTHKAEREAAREMLRAEAEAMHADDERIAA